MSVNMIPGGNGIPGRSIARIPVKMSPKDHYFGFYGLWLRRAETMPFKSPIAPLDWIVRNKPRYEKQPVDFLLSSLSNGNSWVKDNLRMFSTYVSAYHYINNNARARKALNDAYFRLLNDRVAPAQMQVHMVKERLDHTWFTFLRNEHRAVSNGYLKTIIKVYLHYAEDFVNTNEVEPTGPERFESPLHIA